MANDPPNDSSDASVDDEPPIVEAGVGPDYTAPTESLEKWAPLMDGLEDRIKRKIKNRHEFCYWLELWELLYELGKYRDKGPTPKERQTFYEELAKHIYDFRTGIEYLQEQISWQQGPDDPDEPLVKALYGYDSSAIEDGTDTITKFRAYPVVTHTHYM